LGFLEYEPGVPTPMSPVGRTLVIEYYKKLFWEPEQTFFSMVEENNEDIPELSVEESNILTFDFDIE
jgi:hypothetical protein